MGAEVGDPVVLVNPSEVVEVMKTASEGRLITIVEIWKKISKKTRGHACCNSHARDRNCTVFQYCIYSSYTCLGNGRL